MARLALGRLEVAVVAMVLFLLRPCEAALLFNVGLPRTGTTSFHVAAAMMNHTSQHVAFNETRYDLEGTTTGGPAIAEFRDTGTGPLRTLFDSVDVHSDTPVFGLIPALRKWFPDTPLVATTREKAAWLESVRTNPSTLSAFLLGDANLLRPPARVQECTYTRLAVASEVYKWAGDIACGSGDGRSDVEMAARIYDHHAALLKQYGIPTIALGDSDQQKWKTLLHALPQSPTTLAAETCIRRGVLQWPRQNAASIAEHNENRIRPQLTEGRHGLMQFVTKCDGAAVMMRAQVDHPMAVPGEGFAAGAFRQINADVTPEDLQKCPPECVVRVVNRKIMLCQFFMSDLAMCGMSPRHREGINCTECPGPVLPLAPNSRLYR